MGARPMGVLRCSADERTALMRVAIGEEPADIVILNASVVNVYTGELIDDCPVCIKGRLIAAVGVCPDSAVGRSTLVLDAAGKLLSPGFIDGHSHLAWLYSIDSFLPYAIRSGTTTIITETMEFFAVGGCEGTADFLASLKDQPIRILATAPPMVSISRALNGISPADLEKLLERDDIIGLGESYWQGVIQNPGVFAPLMQETLDYGKSVEGHSAGAKGNKLAAYAAAGISSCHEPIQASEALERLRLGIYVMVREGSVRRDLEAISRIRENGIDLRRLVLVTDGVDPRELVENGYLEAAVRKAVELGFGPIQAIRMVTLNVAEHFGLDGYIGGISPGRFADIVVLPDLRDINPELVISQGRIIYRDGKLQVLPRKHEYSESNRHTIRLPRAFEASDFDIFATEPSNKSVNVRVIESVTPLVTTETHITVAPLDGKIAVDLERDILKVAAVDRTNNTGKAFVGLIKGFRMAKGAFASSLSWDTSGITVIGANEEDMALAVNRLKELEGGYVVCADGKVLAELASPIFGILCDLPVAEIAEKLSLVNRAASSLGVSFPDPLLSLVVLTGAAIPYLRICEEGLVNLKDGKTLPLEV